VDRRHPTALVALVVLCASCTTAPTGDPSSAPAADDDVVAHQRSWEGPLMDLLDGSPDPSSPDYLDALSDKVAAEQDAIAACMAEQGFEYVPAELDRGSVTVPDPDVPQEGTRAYVERYGYGITDAPGRPGEYMTTGRTNGYEEMTPEGQAAYDAALHGTRVGVVQHADGSESSDTEGGCFEAARLGTTDPAAIAFESEAMAYLTKMDEDGSFDAIDAAWSRCMAEHGYDHASPRAAYLAVSDASLDIALDENYVQDATAADEVRELEMRTAAADMQCQVDTGYAQAWTELSHAYQQRFLDTHAAEVEAWLEARG